MSKYVYNLTAYVKLQNEPATILRHYHAVAENLSEAISIVGGYGKTRAIRFTIQDIIKVDRSEYEVLVG